jgi:hypothetical protein
LRNLLFKRFGFAGGESMPVAVVGRIEEMIEELHTETLHCVNDADAMLCIAKRDALSELLQRIKGKKPNPYWSRMRPQLKQAS